MWTENRAQSLSVILTITSQKFVVEQHDYKLTIYFRQSLP